MPNFFTHLKTWNVLEVEGPDSQDFLNRLTTVNFRSLAQKSFALGAYLHHTGKTLLVFEVLKRDEGKFSLITPQPIDEAQALLAKMHFAEKLEIKSRADASVYFRIFGDDLAKLSGIDPNGAELTHLASRARGAGVPLVTGGNAYALQQNQWNHSPWKGSTSSESQDGFDLTILQSVSKSAETQKAFLNAGFTEVSSGEPFRIWAGCPSYPNEINDKTMPLECGLEETVAEAKGCYPGQEVIERIHSMGQAPRRLIAVRGSGPVPSTSPLILKSEDQTAAGTLTSVGANPYEAGWVGLAIVKKQFAVPDARLFLDSNPVMTSVVSSVKKS